MEPLEGCGVNFLERLPDELLLMIAAHLCPIRSFETQSQAFKWKAKEIVRQRDNLLRQKTLAALCRTSRRLCDIFESTLYSAVISTSTLKGRITLARVLYSLNKRPKLAENIRYIENRLSDYRGSSLSDEFNPRRHQCRGLAIVADYQWKLATLISKAIHLDHLCVVSLETETTLWRYLLPQNQAVVNDKTSKPLALHGFPQLRTICLQAHTSSWLLSQRSRTGDLFGTLFSAPRLNEIYASSMTRHREPQFTIPRSSTINSLHLFECMLGLEEVCALVDACTALRSFGWSRPSCVTGFASRPFLKSLSAHRDTLRELRLDFAHAMRHDHWPLSDFTTLITLDLCEYDFQWAIATLPYSLETLIIRLPPVGLPDDTPVARRRVVSQYFGREVLVKLPNLKEVQAISTRMPGRPRPESRRPGWAFRTRGIRFTLITIGDRCP